MTVKATIDIPDSVPDRLDRLAVLPDEALDQLREDLADVRIEAEEARSAVSRPVGPGQQRAKMKAKLEAAKLEALMNQAEITVIREKIDRYEAEDEADEDRQQSADEDGHRGLRRTPMWTDEHGWVGR